MPPLPIRNTIAWKVLLFNTFLRDQVNIMAWYYGTYACGHEGRVNVIGPTKDREWKVNHHFEKLCPECYEKWQQEERERKSIEAQKETETLELPELEGTEKQVSWARSSAPGRFNASLETDFMTMRIKYGLLVPMATEYSQLFYQWPRVF